MLPPGFEQVKRNFNLSNNSLKRQFENISDKVNQNFVCKTYLPIMGKDVIDDIKSSALMRSYQDQRHIKVIDVEKQEFKKPLAVDLVCTRYADDIQDAWKFFEDSIFSKQPEKETKRFQRLLASRKGIALLNKLFTDSDHHDKVRQKIVGNEDLLEILVGQQYLSQYSQSLLLLLKDDIGCVNNFPSQLIDSLINSQLSALILEFLFQKVNIQKEMTFGSAIDWVFEKLSYSIIHCDHAYQFLHDFGAMIPSDQSELLQQFIQSYQMFQFMQADQSQPCIATVQALVDNMMLKMNVGGFLI